MVRSIVAFLMLSISAAGSSDGGSSHRGSSTVRLPPIANITIKENAARAPAATGSDETCTRFVLTKRDVLEFLSHADGIPEHDYYHMLDWSPCYASGEIRFKNGQTATWGIHRYRGGSIKFSDGRVRYLSCPKCGAKAFSSSQ
jgi:hypothetical protein